MINLLEHLKKSYITQLLLTLTLMNLKSSQQLSKKQWRTASKLTQVPFCSRRNRLVNPWITSGIIESIQTKTFLYHQWKKTVTETDKVGDNTLYMNYKDFRKTLKNAIIQAKRLNSYKKVQYAEGDCKRTWQLINELRGNKKMK